MTYLIVCGGTAGHINPGLSIAEELKTRDAQGGNEIIFIGMGRQLEKRLIPAAGYELINLKMTGLRRSLKPSAIAYNIKTVFNVIAAKREAARIIKERKPTAVIGTGAYICYPVLKAAAKLKIPTYLHESNACPGLTVRLLSGVVDKVMVTYPGFEKHYKRPENIIVTGTPVRREIVLPQRSTEISHETDEKPLRSSDEPLRTKDKPLVISFFGSLGAERVNTVIEGLIERNLQEKRFCHIHATGAGKKALNVKPQPPYADIREYIDDMPSVLRNADLALCRAGGITLAELAAAGKPAILIPSAFVPDNVQRINAQQFEKVGAAKALEETQCSSESLFETVAELLDDSEKLGWMAAAAKSLGKPNAAKDIVDVITGKT